MKVVAVLLLTTLMMVAVAHASPEKRFFLKEVENVLNNLGHQLTSIINNAKDEFDHLTAGSGISFDYVVSFLQSHIASDATQQTCENFCHDGAEKAFGSMAPMAGMLCPPACKAALAKIQEAAG